MMTVKSISYQVRERNKCKAREKRMRLTEEKAAEVSDDGDDDDDDGDDDDDDDDGDDDDEDNDDDYLNGEMAMRILMMTMMKVIMLKTRKLRNQNC